MKLKKVKTDAVINNFIDRETGEVFDQDIEVKHHKIVVDDREAFCFNYLSFLGTIDELDKVSIKTLFYCNFYCQWNTNMIALTKVVVEDMELKLGIKFQTIKNSISRLKKAGALIHLGASTYRVNPRYFWKWDTTERKKTMKYILEFECKEC